MNTLRFAPAFPTPPSYKERVTSSCASTKTSQSPSSHILNPSSASSSRNLKFYWFSLFLLRLHLLPMVTTASLRPNHSQCWLREWCPQRCAGQDGHTAQPCLSISSMPFYLQLSEGRNEGEKEGGREGRKEEEKESATVYTSSPMCVQVSIPSYFLPSSCPCHSTETTLTGVIDDLLASDGQLQSFVLWISTHLSLRVSHSSLLIVHTLVSVTLYYSDFPPASLSISVSFWNMCVHSSVWSHLLFSGYTVSWTISPFLLASPMCFMKTAHVYFEVESLTWICFPFFLPPGRANTSCLGGWITITCWCIPSHYFWCRLPHLSLCCPSPGLLWLPPNWSSQFHPGQPTIHSSTKPISNVNTPIPYFQTCTDFQLLTVKLMVWKVYGAWLLPPW